MELQFQKSACSCLNTAVREVQNQELTQEMKLTDGMPDIGRVLSAWGQGIMRSKEWRGDSVALSGGMMVWVLYAPEDGTNPRCISGWIPFQMQWPLPDGTREGNIRIRCLTRFADARSVSPRKLMLRAGVGVMAEVFSPMEGEIYAPTEVPEDVELLRRHYPLRLPKEAGEKPFLLDEELRLPESAPQPEKLLCFTLRPEVTDKKVLANKVVFRGNGNLHVLYLSEEGRLCAWDFELPFSQFDELQSSHSGDAQADVALMPTSLELEADDEGLLRLKCGLVGQYVIDDQEVVEIVEDAYSRTRELKPQTEMTELPAVLDARREMIYGEQTLPVETDRVVDTAFLPDFPRQRRREDGVDLEMTGNLQMLYYGEDGSLQSANARWEGNCSLSADGDSRIACLPMGVPQPQMSRSGGGMTAKFQLPMDIVTTAAGGIPVVTGLELGEKREPDESRPSLILRRAGGSGLWETAKTCGSTVAAIRNANHLQEEPEAGQMLIIPVL